MPENEITHLGDGVYAEYDGFAVHLRVNDHRNPIAVTLEPDVMQELVIFYKRMAEKQRAKTRKVQPVMDPEGAHRNDYGHIGPMD